MTRHAPRVGFGDPDVPERFASFRAIKATDGEYGDWEPEPNRTTRQVAGSDDFDVYVGGFGPSRLTLTVRFDDRADYRRIRAMYRANQIGTLSLLAHFTSHEGIVRTHDGVTYEQFRDTFIDIISRPFFRPDGVIGCEITFMRSEASP